MSKRLFIGSMLEKGEQEAVAKLQQSWQPVLEREWAGCELRWVHPEKLHITWLFLGNCSSAQETEIRTRIGELVTSFRKSYEITTEFLLSYSQLEVFGSRLRPSALVLTPPTIPGELSNFANCVRDELSVFCEKQDGHAFRPHLTLLRFPRDYKVAIHIPAGLQESQLLPIHQKLKEISLVESHLGSRNDSYVRLAGFELIERLP